MKTRGYLPLVLLQTLSLAFRSSASIEAGGSIPLLGQARGGRSGHVGAQIHFSAELLLSVKAAGGEKRYLIVLSARTRPADAEIAESDSVCTANAEQTARLAGLDA